MIKIWIKFNFTLEMFLIRHRSLAFFKNAFRHLNFNSSNQYYPKYWQKSIEILFMEEDFLVEYYCNFATFKWTFWRLKIWNYIQYIIFFSLPRRWTRPWPKWPRNANGPHHLHLCHVQILGVLWHFLLHLEKEVQSRFGTPCHSSWTYARL